jgi:hypothetical protein
MMPSVCNQKVTSGQYLLHIASQTGTSEGVHTDGNQWVLDQYCREGSSQAATHHAETSHKSSWQYGSSDLHLFGLLKRHLTGNWLAADANVKQAVTCWLQSLHIGFFYAATQALAPRWDKFLWWLCGIWCVPWATHATISQTHYKVLRISVCFLIFCNFLV